MPSKVGDVVDKMCVYCVQLKILIIYIFSVIWGHDITVAPDPRLRYVICLLNAELKKNTGKLQSVDFNKTRTNWRAAGGDTEPPRVPTKDKTGGRKCNRNEESVLIIKAHRLKSRLVSRHRFCLPKFPNIGSWGSRRPTVAHTGLYSIC